jgi:uncharacterized protein YlxW (UPF0749 family)
MRTSRGRSVMTFVLFVLGVLLVVQLRSQAEGTGLEQRTSSELTTLIANLNSANDGLGSEIAELEQRLRDAQAGGSEGGLSAGELRAELRRLRLWSGLEPVSGPGVAVLFGGPVTADAVNDVVDELRAGGAEAVAVGEVRIVAGSVVGGSPGRLSVEDAALGPEFEVRAIGDPINLAANLVRPDAVIARMQATLPSVTAEVTPLDGLELPASARSLTPVHGRPDP